VSYVLTGEDASYKGVSPINNFDPRNGRWGAFEVTARGGQTEIDEDAFGLGLASEPTSTAGRLELVLGLNWYLKPQLQVQSELRADGVRHGRCKFGDALRDKEDVILTRFQVSY
jgi:phosphate-selective porin OprO/OprP